MQIDFHHGVTYVTARLAGFPHDDAALVAHAAQYVDDATNDGPLNFDNGARYVRVTSAHKTLDLSANADRADNRLVWVPFHFLPGNDPVAPGMSAADAFTARMVCRPGSDLAHALVADCIRRAAEVPFALHRLGITLHTFVDTWAHQHFVGLLSDFNKVEHISIDNVAPYADSDLYHSLTGPLMGMKEFFADHLPVGHAAVVTLPDMPFLHWSFKRASGEIVRRDNPTDFLAAAEAMFNALRRYRAGDAGLAALPLPEPDRTRIDELLRNTLFIEGEARHAVWLEKIGDGAFSFGKAQVEYIESGPGSWKFQALNADPDDESGDEVFAFTPDFLTSDWKRFHDAVQYQRLYILHDLLPGVGISAS